jgi:hypothetical protein
MRRSEPVARSEESRSILQLVFGTVLTSGHYSATNKSHAKGDCGTA